MLRWAAFSLTWQLYFGLGPLWPSRWPFKWAFKYPIRVKSFLQITHKKPLIFCPFLSISLSLWSYACIFNCISSRLISSAGWLAMCFFKLHVLENPKLQMWQMYFFNFSLLSRSKCFLLWAMKKFESEKAFWQTSQVNSPVCFLIWLSRLFFFLNLASQWVHWK